MKKPALLLSLFMVLLALPAQAEMIINDHFDGSSLDPAWNIAMSSNTSGWNYQVSESQIKVNQINVGSGTGVVNLSQQFNPIDDFNAEFGFNWEMPNANTIQFFGIGLFDSSHNRISGIYCDDSWLGGLAQKTVTYGGGSSHSHHGGLPLNGSGTASIVRENGVVSFYWNNTFLTSHTLLNHITSLELMFRYNPYGGASQMGTMNVDYVTLEGEPVDLSATPEPGTMMLLGSALGLGAWWQRRRKRNKQS
jgi:hypothetical protein